MKKCDWCDTNYNELEADRNRLADNLQYQWDSSRFCCLECCQLSWESDTSGSNPFLEGPAPDGQQLCRNSRRMKNNNLKTILSQALARGYCHDANSSKTLDADLIFAMVDEAIEALSGDNAPHEMMSSIFRNLKEIKDFIECETIIQPNVYMFIHSRILNLYSELECINSFLNDLNRRSNDSQLFSRSDLDGQFEKGFRIAVHEVKNELRRMRQTHPYLPDLAGSINEHCENFINSVIRGFHNDEKV